VVVLKGAPEQVLARCQMTPEATQDTLDALSAAGPVRALGWDFTIPIMLRLDAWGLSVSSSGSPTTRDPLWGWRLHRAQTLDHCRLRSRRQLPVDR
jgi:hypothetical protein